MKGLILYILGIVGLVAVCATIESCTWQDVVARGVICLLAIQIGAVVMDIDAERERNKEAGREQQTASVSAARDHTFRTWVKYTRIM